MGNNNAAPAIRAVREIIAARENRAAREIRDVPAIRAVRDITAVREIIAVPEIRAVPVPEPINVAHSRTGELVRHSLHCQVCDQRYNLVDHRPLVLPCNHVICQMCIREHYTTEQSACPICAGPFNARLCVLRVEPHIVSMIEFLNNHRINICDRHDHQLLNFFCKTCFSPVCPDCTILSHRESEGHVVISIDMAIEENFTLFDDIENINSEALRDCKNALQACDGLLQTLATDEPSNEIQIQNKFDELRTLLAQRETTIRLELGRKREEQRLLLQSEHAKVQSDIQELSGLLGDFRLCKTRRKCSECLQTF